MHIILYLMFHFLKNIEKADAIIIGLNPGETKEDFLYNKDLPTEESSEFDFQDIGKSKR